MSGVRRAGVRPRFGHRFQTPDRRFAFSQSLDDDGAKITSIIANNVALTLGDGVTDVSQLCEQLEAFVPAAGTGRTPGTRHSPMSRGSRVDRALAVEFNNTPSAVNRNFHLGSVAIRLNLPARAILPLWLARISSCWCWERALRSNVAFETGAKTRRQTRMRVAISNAVLAIGDGNERPLTVSVAEAGFIVTNHGIAGQFDMARRR